MGLQMKGYTSSDPALMLPVARWFIEGMFIVGWMHRMRGTYSKWVWVNGLVLAVVVVLATKGLTIDWRWWLCGLGVMAGYKIGEMVGWGVGVGALSVHRVTTYEKSKDEVEYGWYTGIQWLAKKLVPISEQTWILHCQVAIMLRGLWFAAWMLAPMAVLGVDVGRIVVGVLILAVGFPLACELGYWSSKKWSAHMMTGGWEHQEIWYGVLQVVTIVMVLM